MAAPMSAASRLRLLPVLLLVSLFVSLCLCSVKSTVVYDRQTLLDIGASVASSLSYQPKQWSFHRALRLKLPEVIWSTSCCCPRTRRARRRGKRAGAAVKLRRLNRCRSPVMLLTTSMAAGPRVRLSCLRPILPASTSQLPAFAPVKRQRPTHTSMASVPAWPRSGLGGSGNRSSACTSVASVPGNLRSLPRASTIGRAGSDSISVGLLNARSIANKSFLLNDFVVAKKLDFLLVSESWQRVGEFASLNELCPPNYIYSCAPRCTGRGGGLASFYRDCFSINTVTTESFPSFEVLSTKVGRSNPFYSILIYRPPGKNGSFLSDFGDFLASVIRYDRVLLCGDFNIHVNDCSDKFASDFLNVTESFNFIQHVSGPTHSKGNTLDLVFTIGLNISNVCTEELFVTDHKCVLFNVSLDNAYVPGKRVKTSRILNGSAVENFVAVFDSNVLVSHNEDVDCLVNAFNAYCSAILDDVAPLVTRSVSSVNTSPWLTEDIRKLRRQCRKVERLWKATNLQVHRLYLKELLSEFNDRVKNARAAYFSNLISSSQHNSRVLFKTINHIVSPPLPSVPVFSNDDCNRFLLFFVNKVAVVRASITPSHSPLPICPVRQATLSNFSCITLADLTGLVSAMKASSSPLDTLPTSLLKEVISSVGPSLVHIINSSINSGSVPSYFKQAVVQPLLKKPNLDPSLPNHYRPISKLPFVSKVLEKVIANQLNFFLKDHNILDKFQSGFRKNHSTESALLRVSNDIMMTSDSGECTVLVLLDLSAAFDTVDHHIMLDRLREWVGISGTALQWFASYLSERSFSVAVGPFRSDSAPLSCGLPQGSVLAPILFALYMLPLGLIISNFKGVSYHCYADDIQLYFSFKSNNIEKISILQECLSAIEEWMSSSFLQLNAAKTEVLIIAADNIASRVINLMGPLKGNVHSNIKNLGVTFDQSMQLDKHVKSMTRTCFFHLRNIAKLRSIISHAELEMSVHAFISSRLDYCNSLFTCLSKASVDRLQLVQNAAARLLTRSKKSCHITPILASLHWLPVQFRIQFKVLVFTYRAIHGQAPAYISDLTHPYRTSRSLRSSDQGLLVVPRTRLKTKGDRAFEAVAPRLWNELPRDIRASPSVDTFKGQLKTHLFRLAFGLVQT